MIASLALPLSIKSECFQGLRMAEKAKKLRSAKKAKEASSPSERLKALRKSPTYRSFFSEGAAQAEVSMDASSFAGRLYD